MIINLDNQTDLSGLYVVYGGSTLIEKEGIYGISHLMEHLICKSFEHMQDTYEENGLSWNAYTSPNEIVFHLSGLDDNVNKYKKEFIELLSDFDISKSDFEKEKRIVLEEYMDSFNDQASSHYLNLERKCYGHYNPIGKREDLEKLKYIDCLNFFEKQFLNPSKIINVSKHNEFRSDIKTVNRNIKTDYEFNTDRDFEYEEGNSFKDKTSLIIKSPVIKDDFSKIKFVNLMLSHGLNSPLYKEVREERGLVYFISSSINRRNKYGDINISTLTSNDNADEVIEATKKVFSSKDDIINKERFNIIKKSATINLKQQDINRHMSVNKWINPDGWNLSECIDSITLDECGDIYDKHFNIDDFYISNSKKEF